MDLYLVPTADARAWYEAAAAAYLAKPYGERDAGLDAFCSAASQGAAGSQQKLDLGVKAAAYDKERGMFRAFWLLPRSSISKTPLRMANSVGLIDAGYRGTLLGATDFQQDFRVAAGDRYYQIVAADLLPWVQIHLVDEIPGGPTLRGEGGFGSTGNQGIQQFQQLPPLPPTAVPQEVRFDAATSTVTVHMITPGSYFS